MNALLRIQVQIATREAQAQLRQLSTAINSVGRTTGFMGAAGGTRSLTTGAKAATGELTRLGRLAQSVNGAFDRSGMGMIQLGKNMQWVGRQINFNFTIPLILAGRAILGWVLETEKAFTRVQKVYGEFGKDYTDELKQIRQGLRMLSDYYGVQIDQVTELAAQWAAAGLAGAPLLDAIKQSINLSILGDYEDLNDVFKQLVTIMGAYNLKAGDLELTLAKLNTVENMTAATLPDLVTGIARAGAAAATAGVDIEHLAALMAVLTPATGSASQAGNALRTMFSRLMAPTKDSIEVLKQVGLDFYSTSFQMLNGAQRLEAIATKWTTLTDAQKANLASTVASRWQFNKFNELMDDMNNKQGTYAKVLESLNKSLDTQNLQEATREIQVLLKSDPRQIQILTTNIKNLLMDALIPALPFIINLLGVIRGLFEWFSSLSPAIQKTAIGILILISAIGIGAQVIGSFRLLIGTFLEFLIWVLQLIPGVSITAAAKTAEAATAMTAAATEMSASTTGLAATTSANGATIVAAMEALAAGVEAGVAQVVASLALLGPGGASAVTASASEMSAAIVAGGGQMAAATAVAEAEVAAGAAAIPAAIGVGWIALIVVIAAAVIAVIVIFRKQIWDAIKAAASWVWDMLNHAFDGISSVITSIGRAFMAIPRFLQNGLEAAVRVVVGLVKIIVHWLSYLNPFARHSPSLVDNVTAGVEAILRQYARLEGVSDLFRKSAADMAVFTAATAAANAASGAKDRGDQKQAILSTSPDAGPAVDQMYANLDALKALLPPLNTAIVDQTRVVDGLKTQYQAANLAIDAFDNSLNPLRDQVDALSTAIDKSKDTIQEYANTNITGMKAASDAIFDNEMAQKRLRLELLKLGDAGQGYEDIRKQLGYLNADIETIRAEMTSLQQGGAGSDVLAVYQEQLDSLNAQKDNLDAAAQQGADLTKQLEQLQRQGEILDLEKSLNFDPLLRQIDELANATKEMSFDDIVKGITDEKTKLADLTTQYDAANASLTTQEAILKEMTTARDNLRVSLDAEQATLDILTQTYSSIEDQIRGIESALNDAASAADNLNKATSGGGGGGGGGFGDLTGDFEDILPTLDESAGSIQDWLDNMQKMFDDIKFDPFAWFKKGWHSVQDFWNKHIGPWLIKIPGWLVHGFDVAWDAIWDFFKKLPGRIAGFFDRAWDWAYEGGKNIIKGLLNGIGEIAAGVWQWFLDLPGLIGGFFVDAINWLPTAGSAILQGLWDGIVLAAEGLWTWFVGIPVFLTGFFIGAGVWLAQAGWDILQGLWDGITDAAVAVWNWFLDLPNRLKGYFFTAKDWLWQKGSDILSGLWNGITSAATAVWNWFTDLPGKLAGYFVGSVGWLAEKGQSILEGLWNGIKSTYENVKTWFFELPGNVKDFFISAVDWLKSAGLNILQGLWNGLKEKWDSLKGWIGDRVQDIKDAFTSGFGLWSPSKVFRGYGENIMLGLHNGLRTGFASIPGELNSMISQVNRAMVDGVSSFSATASLGSTTLSSKMNESSRSLTFNGDLSFPNITDPADADKFIDNLEALAGGL